MQVVDPTTCIEAGGRDDRSAAVAWHDALGPTPSAEGVVAFVQVSTGVHLYEAGRPAPDPAS